MEPELTPRHKQVLRLEDLRRRRGYREGWLYHLCREKGLLAELQELQVAGLVGDVRVSPAGSPGDNDDLLSGERRPLTVELVPSTSWFTNVRSEVTAAEWLTLRAATLERAEHRCEICSARATGIGSGQALECHEIWEYDDTTHVQRLAGLMALCPACHEAKHIGLAGTRGRGGSARAHIARINGWSIEDVDLYLEVQFEQWSRRSQHEWQLDLSWLEQFGIAL